MNPTATAAQTPSTMRDFTLIAFAALLALPLQSQVIFESGFEDWDGNLPADWFGARTNLPQSGVAQVSDNVFEGDFAVRLTREATGHQRFTTQQLTVENGQAYEVVFMVRGEGQIRLGLYDGRPSGSGYSPYTSWVTITGNTWQEVTLAITAAMDASDAEFILSIQSTVAPEHLVVDDVTISTADIEPPPTISVQEIQQTTDPGGASPLVGQTVATGGIVTAVANNGFWIQNGGGPWSGIFVFSTQVTPARGDSVRFSANVVEFDFPGFEPLKETQLSGVSGFVNVSSGNPLVTTDVSTADVSTEPYEGVLVQVNAATCTNPDAGFGQFLVDDGSGACRVGDLIYDYNAMLNAVYNITGPVKFSNQEYKILPRDANDVEVVTGIAEQAFGGVQLFPNPASDVLNIHLGRMESRTEYTLADATGRVVRADVLRMEQGTVGVAGLAPGSYVLTLRNGDTIWSTRVMVQR
jgi:hypothetical protein